MDGLHKHLWFLSLHFCNECLSHPKKKKIDPFQYEEQFASGRAVEKRLRRQAEMFDVFDKLVDNEDIAVDAYG